MRIPWKVFLLFLITGLFVLIITGFFSVTTLEDQYLNLTEKQLIAELGHFDYALSNSLAETKYDILAFSHDPLIKSPDDEFFTSYLNVTPDTFVFNPGPVEEEIIVRFNEYRISHPMVNSVYMGRENGAFVRSHPRTEATRYDPRERPWYLSALADPGNVVLTDPYRSITTPDLNIGVVSTLIRDDGTVYGVVGADITLPELTSYLAGFSLSPHTEIILVNQTGTIIAHSQEEYLAHPLYDLIGEGTEDILTSKSGHVRSGDVDVFYYTSEDTGWKILVTMPVEVIQNEVADSIKIPLLCLIFGLILLSSLTLTGLHLMVIRPLQHLTSTVGIIADTGDLTTRIVPVYDDEIGTLSMRFNEMVEAVERKELDQKQIEEELKKYRDHLEELVRQRTAELQELNVELLSAKDAAEAADRIKSAFLATMSHELRTPLNSIIGFTGILLQELAGPLNEEQKKQLGMVQTSARHLLALINDVLDISKIESGQLRMNHEWFNLADSIQTVGEAMRPEVDRKGILFFIDISPDIGDVYLDKRRVEQIVMNLMSNAVKFTEKGRIHLSCHREGDKVMVSVADTGIGIQQEDLEKIFQAFYQIDSTIARKHTGTGLGLSITKKLVEMMDGRIEVTGVLGKGSVFTITLPVSGSKEGQ